MSSGVAASLRRIFVVNQHHRLLILSTCSNPQKHRTFSMQYKDTEKAPHPFDYINKNYSKSFLEKFFRNIFFLLFRFSSKLLFWWSLYISKYS
jgi:hypothetical protein